MGEHEHGKCGEGVRPKRCSGGGNLCSPRLWRVERRRRGGGAADKSDEKKVSHAEAAERVKKSSQRAWVDSTNNLNSSVGCEQPDWTRLYSLQL